MDQYSGYYFPNDYYQSMLAAINEADPSLAAGFAANFTQQGDYWYVNDLGTYQNWLQTYLFPDDEIDPWFLQYTSIFTGTSNQGSGTQP